MSWISARRRLAGYIFRPVLHRLDELERSLEETRVTAPRGFETARWMRVLSDIRAAPDYGAAFEGEPLVTVRIATYNGAKLLCERTIPSLLRQTYGNWEAIVVGDACTDDTEQRIGALCDPRIRFFNLPFRGPYPEDPKARWQVAGIPAMNFGLQAANGHWIAALDHDDEFDSDHIEVLLREAQQARTEVAYGKLRVLVVPRGEILEHSIGTWPPQHGRFAFGASIIHAGMRRFQYDINCHLGDEPGDWNLARRMWDAGVRFSFVERDVGTFYLYPRGSWQGDWAAGPARLVDGS